MMKHGVSLQRIVWAAIFAAVVLAELGCLAVYGALHLP